ncbi:MAG: OstA-like protein [bacterium]|nr:OstA-like protein [bacterium]
MRALSCGLAVLALAAVLFAQSRTPVDIRAKSLVVTEQDGVVCRELRGSVIMTKDSLNLTCENALQYPDSGLTTFLGNVEIRDPYRVLLADRVIYNEITEEIDATQRVRIYQSDTLSATAKRARYREQSAQAYLFDDVRIRERNRRLLLTGQIGYLDHDRRYGRMTGNPVLTETDSLLRTLTVVSADTIETFADRKLVRASGHVRVERDSLVASGESLDYFTDMRAAILVGSPEAERGDSRTEGDTLKLYFEEEKLAHVEIIGHAITTSPADSGFAEPLNRMEGQRMTLWMTDGAVTESLIEDNAIATYYVRDQGQKTGLNVTSGDRLYIYFDDRKMSRIRVEGGTQGTYTPQRLVAAPADSARKP